MEYSKGTKFEVKHSDGVVIAETVSHVIKERISKRVDLRQARYPFKIYTSYYESRTEVMIVCDSGAVYEPNEIN